MRVRIADLRYSEDAKVTATLEMRSVAAIHPLNLANSALHAGHVKTR